MRSILISFILSTMAHFQIRFAYDTFDMAYLSIFFLVAFLQDLKELFK